jgi:hypothetical protein
MSYDNGDTQVNFATSESLIVTSIMFPHRNIHKYAWTSPDGKNSHIDHILTGKRRRSSQVELIKILTIVGWLLKLGTDC